MYHGHLDPRQRLTHQLSLCYSKSQRVCENRAGGQKKTWSYSHSFVITVCQSRWTEEDLVLLSFLCHHRMSEPVGRRRLGPTLIPKELLGEGKIFQNLQMRCTNKSEIVGEKDWNMDNRDS